ncbi:hypothetical protein QBC38DRAFT_375114 [Podospora fimiseda]|uniref:Uncharacterized protein n=1 Tax=Podospora fimiseda TaxID=252190 RepID=A0AAN6YPS5_9PEZI|nr:hypothetical protein QBC38DRAFT_375114 [Podospora fimiseda]
MSNPNKPPYPPPAPPPGLPPTPLPDIPLSGIFILLYLLYIPLHLFFSTHSNPHSKPILTIILTIFPSLRIISLSLRISWSLNPSNLQLEIASTALTFAGVLLLYILNLLVSRRYVRDYAISGYRPIVKGIFRSLIGIVLICLIMGVIVSVNVYFVSPKDKNVLRECRDVLLVSGTILAVLAFTPVIMVVLVGCCCKAGDVVGIEKKRYRARTELLVGTAGLLSLEGGFRVGMVYEARLVGEEEVKWWEGKAAFYCFVYLVEVVVVYWVLAARFDGRFRKRRIEGEGLGVVRGRRGWRGRVNTQEEVFGDPG